MRMRLFVPLVLGALLAVPFPEAEAQARKEPPKAPPQPAASPAPAAPPEVEIPGVPMVSKLIEVKYVRPSRLYRPLNALRSRAPGSNLLASDELGTISVRDLPENVTVIEKAVQRLDVPATAAKDQAMVELRFYLLLGRPSAGPDEVSPEIEGPMKAIRSTLSFRSYRQLGSFTTRVTNGSRRVQVGGGLNVRDTVDAENWFELESASLTADSVLFGWRDEKLESVALEEARFSFRYTVGGKNGSPVLRESGFSSTVSLRPGETAVLGTTTMGDRGLIVIVRAVTGG